MAKARGDFTDILVRNGDPRPRPARRGRAPRQPAPASSSRTPSSSSSYATQTEVMAAIAEFHSLQFVDLDEVEIPKAVIELVPESVARENVVLPLSLEGNVLKIITCRPDQLRHHPEAPVHPEQGHPAGPGRPRADPRGHQPALRPDRNRVGGLDARRVHRHGHRLHRDRSRRKHGRGRRQLRRPGRQAVQPDHPGSGQPAGVSDIHIEPFADRVRVRYRIDGVLVERDAAPRRLLAPMTLPLQDHGSRSTSPRSAGPRTAGSR